MINADGGDILFTRTRSGAFSIIKLYLKMKKTVILFILLFLANVSFSQNVTCGKITISDIGTQGMMGPGGKREQSSYRVFSAPGITNSKFGVFYATLKPYVVCDPNKVAAHYFSKTVLSAQLKVGFFGAFVVNSLLFSHLLSDPTQKTGRAPYLVVGVGCGAGMLISYIIQRVNLKKCLKEHNSLYGE
jgi:hypothetical protein